MKIAITFGFFLPVPPARGGATEKIWFSLGRHLAARDHDVTLYSRRWEDWPEAERIDGLQMKRVAGWDHRSRRWQNLWLDYRWGLRLRRLLPRDSVVISNNVFLPILLRRQTGRPAPVCVVLGRMPKGQVRWYGAVDRIYATSEAVAAKARRENPGASGRVRVLRNAIDWPSFQGAPLPDRAGAVRIGYAGRIHPEKGLDLLVRAAGRLARRPELPNWEVDLLGPVNQPEGGGGESYLSALRQLAAEVGAAERVKISGPVYTAAALAQFYRGLDVFCYPSRAEKGEGLSVAPLEAMAAGVVPVLSHLECYHDVIRPEANGILFDHRAADADARLARELASLLLDPGRRQRLGAAARATARRFDYEAVAVELDNDLTALLAGSRSRV